MGTELYNPHPNDIFKCPKCGKEFLDWNKSFAHNSVCRVMNILKDPKLFTLVTEVELDKKIVGEIPKRKVIFLCGCGAFVANAQEASYNLTSDAESGSGKDWITKCTLSIFEKDKIYIKRTRISEKVLTYWHNSKFEPEWTWDGKILYLEDISSSVLNSDVFKVMCSSGSHATVLINQTPCDIEIKGKPVIIITTAKATPKKEMRRRFPIISLDESEDQSRAIMKAQARSSALGINSNYDEQITQALSYLKRVTVKVPFGEKLVDKLPAGNIIIRTAFPRFLDYIKASCALHQFQRKQDIEGFYLATKEDYEIARECFQQTISNQYMIPLTHEQKKLIRIIDEESKQESLTQVNFTVAELAEKVNFWDERWLRKQLDELADCEILQTGKRATDAKKPSKTYSLNSINQIQLPKWDDL